MPTEMGIFERLSLTELRRRKSSKWVDVPRDVLPAWVAELDVPLAPPVRDALVEAIERGDTGYFPERAPEVAEAFTEFAGRRFGWSVLPANVSVAPDVTSAIDQVVRLFNRPGERVAMFVPAYPPFYETLDGCGAHIVPLRFVSDEHGWQVDIDALEHALAAGVRTLLLNNPHNPTGKAFTETELENILDLVSRYDAFVVSDEVHAPLTLPGSRHIPWLSLGHDAAARGVAVTAASKAFNIAGLKCAVLVAEGQVRERLARLPNEFKVMAGLLGAIASTAAFLHGDPWLDSLIHHLDSNREILRRQLDPLEPHVRWIPPQATYLAWLNVSACGLGPDPAKQILTRTRLALSRGQDYDPIDGAGWVRLNFGTTSAILDEILSRLKAVLSSPELRVPAEQSSTDLDWSSRRID